MGKKFSELERAVGLNNGDLAAFAQVDQSAPTGYKSKAAPMSLVSQKILKDTEYASDLQTDDKTVLGAINEVNSKTVAYDVASGSIANFKTSLERPIKSLGIDVNAIQAAGTPTPALPLPISGWNEIKISQVGKNLLSINDVVFEQFDERSLQNPIPSGNYVFSGVFTSTDTDSNLCSVVFVDKDNNTITSKSLSRDIRTSVSLDLSKDCYKIRFYAATSWPSSSGDTGSFSDLQIELGSIATEYEPYDANSELISLGGTYYGGHFTQDKDGHRQFEVTHGIIDLGDPNWYYSVNDNWFQIAHSHKYPTSNNLCSCYPVVYSLVNLADKTLAVVKGYLAIKDTSFGSDVNAFKTAMTGQKLVYELATPYTIDLPDGEPIITLNGTNNIYADSGDASVEYALTIEEYIDKKIASVQALILNS